MSKSHKITSGRFRRASSTPETPSTASKTFHSVRANNLDRARRLSSSSSIINTLGIGLILGDSILLSQPFSFQFLKLVRRPRSLAPTLGAKCQSGSDPSMSRVPFAPFRISVFQFSVFQNRSLLRVLSFSLSTLERFGFEAERWRDHWRLAKDQCSRRPRRLTDSSRKYQGVLTTMIRSSPPRNSLTFKSVARWLYRKYSYQCVS